MGTLTSPTDIDEFSDTYVAFMIGTADDQVTDTEWVISGIRNYNKVSFTTGGSVTVPHIGHIF